MKKFDPFVLVVILGVLTLAFMIFKAGESYGYDQRGKFQDELDCTVPYSNKPQAEVPVKCLKYFGINSEKSK